LSIVASLIVSASSLTASLAIVFSTSFLSESEIGSLSIILLIGLTEMGLITETFVGLVDLVGFLGFLVLGFLTFLTLMGFLTNLLGFLWLCFL